MRKNGVYNLIFEVLEQGRCVAFDEILLADTQVRRFRPAKGRVTAEETPERIVLRAGKTEAAWDKASGRLVSWTRGGRDLIDPSFGFRPNFWRAPNDNDYGNQAPRRLEAWKNPVVSAACTVAEETHGATVRVHYTLVHGTTMDVDYLFRADGILCIDSRFHGNPASELDIPRIGYRFRLASDRFRYFGRGPMENYQDRCTAALRSIWTSSAQAEYYPYVRPQETGHHTGTYWLEIAPLCIVGDTPFEFSALRQSVEDLDGEEASGRPYQWNNFSPDENHDPEQARGIRPRQTHLCDVPVRPWTEVCVDCAMSGVGGYDSWGARTEKERTLWAARDYAWRIALVPGVRGEKAFRREYLLYL